MSARVIIATFPERHTGRSLRFRWLVDSFIHTGCIRYVAWRWIIAATLRGSIRPYRLYSERGGRQIAAPTVTLVGSAAQPHRFYLQRGGRQICRPYWRNSIQPHEFYSQRPRNGTQAVPYGFADWCIFLQNVFQKRARPFPK